MHETPLSRKEREKLRHREEILETALRLFSAKGFHNVSMQEIAEESEFAVGTLYNFFESKELMFEELGNTCARKITEGLLGILDRGGNEVERLTGLIRNMPEILADNAEFIKLYVSELGIKGARFSKERDHDEFHALVTSKVEQLFAEGIRKGLFRCVDPVIAAKVFDSTMKTLGIESAGRFDKSAAAEMFEKFEDIFLHGVAAEQESRR
jgi:AcrR family transcriptional regulator